MPVKRFGVITDIAKVSRPQLEVFKFLADFSNTARWDPGVVAASRDQPDTPVAVGSSFSVTTVFKGTESLMTYTITELEEPNKIVLVGESPTVWGRDTITFAPLEGDASKTLVDYTAEISLKGLRKPFIVFLSSTLDKLGRDAMEGLEKHFAGAGAADAGGAAGAE